MDAKQYLLIDLDALLDTRLGCLIRHRPQAAADIDMGAYRGRLHDRLWEFCDDVSEAQWRQWWTERDVGVLKSSLATPMMFRLKAMTYELVATKASHTYITDIKVMVNTYPYRLTEEQTSVYRQTIQEIVARGVEVSMVSLPPAALAPKTLLDHYHYYALYDLDAWLTAQHAALEEVPIPAFSMNAPALYQGHEPSQADIEDAGLSQKEEAFAQWELWISAHLMLGFLPAAEYSQLL